MKMILLALLITAVLSFTTIILFLKDDEQPIKRKLLALLSKNGYWVIDSKTNLAKQADLHFYTHENKEALKQEINGIELNGQKRKYKRYLKVLLNKAVEAWTVKKPFCEMKTF